MINDKKDKKSHIAKVKEMRAFIRTGIRSFATLHGKTFYKLQVEAGISSKSLDQLEKSGNAKVELFYRLGLAVGYKGEPDAVIAKVIKDFKQLGSK